MARDAFALGTAAFDAAALALGAAALFSSAVWGNLFMAAGFGLVQIAFGIWIALRYGC